jgi:hypothetical protein
VPIDYEPGAAWPPAEVAEAAPHYREWLTWYRGKADELHRHYSRIAGLQANVRPSQLVGGLQGFLARAWWGRPLMSGAQRIHLPTAADVSSLSAALIYADPPQLTLAEEAGGDKLQKRLDEILREAQVYAALQEAAEKQSAAGGVYVRASANVELADTPIVESILPDRAVPEFYGPWLTAVTFWRTCGDASRTGSGPVLRHLERHEMERGVCVIYHALYQGNAEKLGKLVSLNDAPETKRFAELVDETGRIVIGTSKLDVVYVPNLKPHPLLDGSPLGRSDYCGAEDVMDNADEIWTALIRDFRLGKARLMVPRGYVRRVEGEGGAGGYFDPEQEIYSQVNAQPGNADSTALMIEKVQFDIRVDQHLRGLDEAWRIILKRAGLDGNENQSESTPETATATNAKASRKRTTRQTKIRLWDPNLRRLAFVLLELDNLYFRGQAAAPVETEWPDAAAPDMETLARTVQLLDAAGAVSDRTKVAMVHPDWEDEQIDEEVLRIKGDAPPPPDPADPNALPEPDTQPVDEPVDDEPDAR